MAQLQETWERGSEVSGLGIRGVVGSMMQGQRLPGECSCQES